ncbi:hypothetical protein JCM10207_001323 [Rhodosporidiobolus poonsookiae]
MSSSSLKDHYETGISSDSKSPSELEASVGAAEDRFASIDRKALMRRVDIAILPWTLLTYMVVRLDLNNINNAGTLNKETGHSLKQMLDLDAQQWAWVVACFYYTYMFIEPPATLLVKKYSPSTWLARIMVSWGAVMACMAAVKNYGGLITCRVLLGLLEGSFFPAIIFQWSFWYLPSEMAPRVLYLYIANVSSGGFSGLIAYGISYANSKTIAGWQVLFITEGLLTVALGIGTYFILPDWPSTSKWLTPLQREYLETHLHKDSPKLKGKTFDWTEIRAMLADPTFFLFTGFWACWSVSAWGASTMQTFLILDLGVADSRGTQLLQLPPAATGVMICLVSALLIRKFHVSPFLCALGIVGGAFISFIVLLKAPQAGVRFAALCVITGSAPSAYACLWPRRVASLRGTSAAALGVGLLNAISQFSGILGPQLWRTDYAATRYANSCKAAIAFTGAAFLIVCALWYLMEGNISWSPYLRTHVLAQTQLTDADKEAEARGETVGAGAGDGEKQLQR